jgi:hypothetical protein
MQRTVIETEMGNIFGGTNTARIPTWINKAMSRIVGLRQWSFLLTRQFITLVAGQEGYPLSLGTVALADYGGALDVALVMTTGGFGVPLMGADTQLYDRMTRHNTVNGVPMIWAVSASTGIFADLTDASKVRPGGQLELRVAPRPTAVAGQGQQLDVLYQRTLEHLKPTSSSHELIGPEAFGWLVMDYACAIGFAETGNLPNAQAWLAMAQQALAGLITQDEKIMPIRDSNRLVAALPPALSGPTAGQEAVPDLPLPIARGAGNQ